MALVALKKQCQLQTAKYPKIVFWVFDKHTNLFATAIHILA